MSYIPLNYSRVNSYESLFAPQDVNAQENVTFWYWQRILFQAIQFLYDFTLPVEWPDDRKDLFKWLTFRYGFNVWFNDDRFGLLCQPASLSGLNVDFGPTQAVVTNQAFNDSRNLLIGVDCEVFKLAPDYIGVWPIVTYYAEKLSSLDNGMDMSILNSKVAKVFAAKNKSVAQTLKAIEDEIQKGNGLVITNEKVVSSNGKDSEPLIELDFGMPKDKYLLNLQLQDHITLLHNFYNHIGIPTVPYQKKERMTAYESQSTQVESDALCKVWLDTMNERFEAINSMFGTSCHVDLAIKDADNLVDGEEDGDVNGME